jgi:hypothetical protein
MPIAALFLTVGVWRNWTTAYLVLNGSEAPGDAHVGVFAVLLSIGGYLIVPLVVGTGVAGFFQRSVEKKMRLDLEALAQRGLPPGGTGTGDTEVEGSPAATPVEAGRVAAPENRATTQGGGTR